MEAVKAYELEIELAKVLELMRALELKLAEAKEAEAFLRGEKNRRLYHTMSGLLVEVTREEALEHVEKLKLAYERELKKLRARKDEIKKELKKLKAPLV